jgi:excisionase family DNA binding protein
MTEVASYFKMRYTITDMKKIEDKDYYSLQEVAKILGVSVRSLYRYIDSGRLRAVKVGYWRISKKDLEYFLKRNASVNRL